MNIILDDVATERPITRYKKSAFIPLGNNILRNMCFWQSNKSRYHENLSSHLLKHWKKKEVILN